MSMITMRGYVPKDDPMYPGQPKVISRFGFSQSSADTLKRLDGAAQVKLASATDSQDGNAAPVEEEISQAEMGLDGISYVATA